MEYEIGQLKLQIDRLQMRVHSLVEEQADMVEKERVQIEKHFHNQVHNMREELERQAADLGKAGAEIEQRKGTVNIQTKKLAVIYYVLSTLILVGVPMTQLTEMYDVYLP